jgi:predicted nucleic acid-binding protein
MSETESRAFVDTNIWLYALIEGQDTTKSSVASELLHKNRGSFVVSTQVINEICVNMLRKANANESTVQKLIRSFFHRYDVVLLEETVMLTASDLREQYSFSYWDSLIVASALAAEASILYSEDMQSGQVINEKLKITNPFIND